MKAILAKLCIISDQYSKIWTWHRENSEVNTSNTIYFWALSICQSEEFLFNKSAIHHGMFNVILQSLSYSPLRLHQCLDYWWKLWCSFTLYLLFLDRCASGLLGYTFVYQSVWWIWKILSHASQKVSHMSSMSQNFCLVDLKTNHVRSKPRSLCQIEDKYC